MTATARNSAACPVLSVLIPFYRDDPSALIRAIDEQARTARAGVEIIACDDGSNDAQLTSAMQTLKAELITPLHLVSKSENEGRSAARNTLASHSNGEWVLFLDADMFLPAGFIAKWLAEIEHGDFDAAFGGFDAEPATTREGRVHAAIASASDTGGANERGRRGAAAFCTSNLLVRSSILPAVPFDETFKGWGWEDVDWAVRAEKAGRLKHVDNPAGHRGWQSVEQLLARYRDAAGNYARLLEKHPELSMLPAAKAAKALRGIPGQAALRGLWEGLAKNERAPMRVRTLALKLWRASWAADVLPEDRTGPYIPAAGLRGKLVRINARMRAKRPMSFTRDRPIVSITFDDFPASAIQHGRAALERRGWRGTWYASAGFVGKDTHHGAMLTLDDVRTLDAAGHEIACHTHSHTDAARTPLNTMLADVEENARVLAGAAPGLSLENYAFPYGEASPEAKTALQQRFCTLRGVRPGVNRTGSDLNLLNAVGIDGGSDGIARALDWIADAGARPGWLILYAHDIQDRPTEWGCTPLEFNAVLDAIEAIGADVMTVRDAAREIGA